MLLAPVNRTALGFIRDIASIRSQKFVAGQNTLKLKVIAAATTTGFNRADVAEYTLESRYDSLTAGCDSRLNGSGLYG